MKLFQIEYLVAVCRYGSISQAADALLVSRPAVSRAVRDLEEEFGVPLLQRNTTGVVLTEAGQVFYEKCLKIQQMLAELGTEMASFKCGAQDESDRVLSIGISFTARCVVLPFINAFHHEFPEVKIRLTDIERAFLDSRTLVPDYDLEIALCSGERVEGVKTRMESARNASQRRSAAAESANLARQSARLQASSDAAVASEAKSLAAELEDLSAQARSADEADRSRKNQKKKNEPRRAPSSGGMRR